MLAIGLRPADLRDHQRGVAVASDPTARVVVDYDTWVGGARPRIPKPGIGSLKLLGSLARHPHRLPLTILLAACAPPGRGSLDGVRDLIRQLDAVDHWPDSPALRVVAVDLDSGTRVLFGTPGAPLTDLATAVTASCAIPAWFAPVQIDGRRLVDGCAWSDTNVDLLVGQGLDEVVVLAPTSARRMDHPRSIPARVERRLRRIATRRLLHETELVRAEGSQVRLIVPGPEDLAVMGANLMNPVQRLTVLETSLRTTAAVLRNPSPHRTAKPPASG
ncbi:patatin-like phospholipase family protein [Streptomyces sp. NPDC001276]|uniref:patatin-like phospholipase family protein n=1 Tax=Streptomyces sp. NPDC001276 TaxID=3364555 RepID=UPI00369AF230